MTKALLFATSLSLLAAAGWLGFEQLMNGPGPGGDEVLFTVEPGESLRQVSQQMGRQRLISHPLLFEINARLTGKESAIKAGEYQLSPADSMRALLARLVSGEALLHRVTIAEGLTIPEIAAHLVATQIITDPQRFITASHDAALMAQVGAPGPSMEGILYPETYHFPRALSATEVVRTMTQQFYRVAHDIIDPTLLNNPKKLNALLTMASLIEKETSVADERPLVAAVYYNRLRKRMRLQCDPTVIYALPNFDGNIRKKDLTYDHPYNTYVRYGLPPGPIANPGRAAIIAALQPAQSDYLYFVAFGDGSGRHHFSKNLAEHNRAVRKYQIARKQR